MSSNEFEHDNSKAGDSMVLIRDTKDPRQSHSLMVFVEPKQCGVISDKLCVRNSNVGFRYYKFDVEATDLAGNTGSATAYVVIVPEAEDLPASRDSEGALDLDYFTSRMVPETSPASNVIQTKDLFWDTTREDPPDVPGVSVSVVETVSAEMTISGITIPDSQEELNALILALEATLNGLNEINENSNQRRLEEEECTCNTLIKVLSISDMAPERRLQAGGVDIVYEMIQVGKMVAVCGLFRLIPLRLPSPQLTGSFDRVAKETVTVILRTLAVAKEEVPSTR